MAAAFALTLSTGIIMEYSNRHCIRSTAPCCVTDIEYHVATVAKHFPNAFPTLQHEYADLPFCMFDTTISSRGWSKRHLWNDSVEIGYEKCRWNRDLQKVSTFPSLWHSWRRIVQRTYLNETSDHCVTWSLIHEALNCCCFTDGHFDHDDLMVVGSGYSKRHFARPWNDDWWHVTFFTHLTEHCMLQALCKGKRSQ